jgi:hypothetical protein
MLTLGRATNKPRDRPHTKLAIEADPSNIKLPPIKQVRHTGIGLRVVLCARLSVCASVRRRCVVAVGA